MLARLSLLFMLMCALGACKKELYQGLTQREANEMVAVLSDSGIEAEREKDGTSYRVMVDSDDMARAVRATSAAGLPHEAFKSLDEIFPPNKLISTPLEQKARLGFAMNQDLAKSVMAIDGVTFARVHVSVPESDLRGAPIGKTTASVAVRIKPAADVTLIVPHIKMLVSNGVPNLDYKDVNVIAVDGSFTTSKAETER
jgi:type III secretion protein J